MAGAFTIAISAATPLAVQGVFYLAGSVPSEINKGFVIANQILKLEKLILDLRIHVAGKFDVARDHIKEILVEPFAPTPQHYDNLEISQIQLRALPERYGEVLHLTDTREHFKTTVDLALAAVLSKKAESLEPLQLHHLAVAYDIAVQSLNEFFRTLKVTQLTTAQQFEIKSIEVETALDRAELVSLALSLYMTMLMAFVAFTWIFPLNRKLADWLFVAFCIPLGGSIQWCLSRITAGSKSLKAVLKDALEALAAAGIEES